MNNIKFQYMSTPHHNLLDLYINMSTILFYILTFISMVLGEECTFDDPFSITSTRYPSASGCYRTNRFDYELKPVFSSTDSGSGRNIVMLTEGQYFLFFYGFDSTTTICASNLLDVEYEHHPIEILKWDICNPSHGKSETDIHNDDIIITCGCDYREFDSDLDSEYSDSDDKGFDSEDYDDDLEEFDTEYSDSDDKWFDSEYSDDDLEEFDSEDYDNNELVIISS